jgi:asparagine synthase (glutamine-hydrolysing)
MCGVAGIFNLNREGVDEHVLRQMTRALQHRGPDGEGVFLDENIGLGHRRLAILDLSENGAQPMTSFSGRWVISFNGCIYNFKELRTELESKGFKFKSTSDTEVIANGLDHWGTEVFSRFNGMFSVLAWDKKERRLIMSRDRFGVKPLYYWFNGKTLLAASEFKTFYAHPAFRAEVNLSALNEYFTFQNLFSFQTLLKGVTLIPPANTIVVTHNDTMVKHQSWWDYDFSAPDEKMDFEEAKSETKRLLEQAVKRQMVADVPVGAYLSGGMDSGSITSIASGMVPRLFTFTGGFDMSSVTGVEANYDERRDAELMANHFKTEQYEQVMNAGDLKWSLPRVIYHLEDLRVGMSYPNYYVSRLASKFVKVCLQGTGGDELFGGYPWRYFRIFDSTSPEHFFDQYYGFWQRLVGDSQKEELFAFSPGSEEIAKPRKIFENVFRFNKKLKYQSPEDHIQNSLYFEIKTFLPGLLMVGDKLSMANGLEERFPFLDNDLVNFAQRIPVKHKLESLEQMKKFDENLIKKRLAFSEYNDGKNVLRAAMKDYIPERIVQRKKQGFSAPDESWYRGENAEYVKDVLLSGKPVSSEFINPAFIRKIVDEHVNQRINHRLLIWSFLSFEWWCRIFLKGEKPGI